MLQRATKSKKVRIRTRVFDIADEHGVSQRWLATQYGLNEAYLSELKTGRKPISRQFMERSCQLFPDYDFDQLFFVEDVKDIA